jgi:hypothetical protein
MSWRGAKKLEIFSKVLSSGKKMKTLRLIDAEWRHLSSEFPPPLLQCYWPIYSNASREEFREFLKLRHDCFLQYLSKSPPPWRFGPISGHDLPLRSFASHSLDTLHSVGLLWTSDQPEAETSAWQETNIHVSGWVRTKSPIKQVVADLRLRRRSHWDWPFQSYDLLIIISFAPIWNHGHRQCHKNIAINKYALWPEMTRSGANRLCSLLYAFFWVITRRLNFICQRFGALCLFHLHRRVGMKND